MEIIFISLFLIFFGFSKWVSSLKKIDTSVNLVFFTTALAIGGAFILGIHAVDIIMSVILSLLCLLLLSVNIKKLSLWIFTIGAGMNTLVVLLNKGMPVNPEKVAQIGVALHDIESSPRHILANEFTSLSILGDWIIIQSLFIGKSIVVSPGDMLMCLAVVSGSIWSIFYKEPQNTT